MHHVTSPLDFPCVKYSYILCFIYIPPTPPPLPVTHQALLFLQSESLQETAKWPPSLQFHFLLSILYTASSLLTKTVKAQCDLNPTSTSALSHLASLILPSVPAYSWEMNCMLSCVSVYTVPCLWNGLLWSACQFTSLSPQLKQEFLGTGVLSVLFCRGNISVVKSCALDLHCLGLVLVLLPRQQ